MKRIHHSELMRGGRNVTVEVDVKPCPFCGCEDIVFCAIEDSGPDRDYGLGLTCVECGGTMMSGLSCIDSESAYYACAEMWNRRPEKGLTDEHSIS